MRYACVPLAFAVLITLFPSSVWAQPYRGFIDVNFIGASSAQDEQLFETSFLSRGTLIGAATAYPALPNAKGFDIGGGVLFGSGLLGVGVQWDRATYAYTAGIGLSGLGIFTSLDAATTDPLERTQHAVDIRGVVMLPTPDAWRIKVFGGPTYFSVTQEMVSDFTFVNLAGLVAIGTHTTEDVKESGWGFNVGADVAYFFARHVGVGGVVRFNQATLAFDDP